MNTTLVLNVGLGLLFALSVALFADLISRRSWLEDWSKAGLPTDEEVDPEQGVTDDQLVRMKRFAVKWQVKMILTMVVMTASGIALMSTLPGFMEVYMVATAIMLGVALWRMHARRRV